MNETFVKASGVNLCVSSQGTGPDLVTCPGGPGCCDYFEPVAEMIEDLVTVHRYDPRGCGRSGAKPPYNVANAVADLEAIRRHLRIEEWYLCGHSAGACIALAYALSHPNRVKRIIYLAGTGITWDWHEEYHQARSRVQDCAPHLDYPFNEEVNKAGTESWKRYIEQPGLEDRIRKLDMPVLVMHGMEDPHPSRPAQQLAQLLPRARFHLVEGAGHYIWLHQPRRVRELLRGFLCESGEVLYERRTLEG